MGRVVGIVGGGQLARMTCQAASPAGLEVRVFAAPSDESARSACTDVTIGDCNDAIRLERWARDCDVVTFDHENVDPTVVEALERAGHTVLPGSSSLRLAADKLVQRAHLREAGLPVPAFAAVSGPSDVAAFAADHGWPVVLKTPRGGYDGRGVWIVDDLPEAIEVCHQLEGRGTLLVEELQVIERELAVLVARRASGDHVVYPTVETVQQAGVCRVVVAPAPIDPALARGAQELAVAAAEAVDAVGVLAVEIFATPLGLVVNELAPRPHNSGHVTIDASVTSQFENHLRAVLDLPLGSPALRSPGAMVNLLAPDDPIDPVGALPDALADPSVRVHLYDKQSRPGRKIGHVNVCDEDWRVALDRALRAAERLLAPAPRPARRRPRSAATRAAGGSSRRGGVGELTEAVA
ncbi:MAG: 5-(carboxyamino)imidazole ribonucleotide synthase [Acidimicrobiales bacterium]|jgi:5-(carboxyamino)imidazole ribonucleotide synthase|nr:5-(carboxyamino)imidazole ribonucleotide synthase [Acidimicrobiales bacterium]